MFKYVTLINLLIFAILNESLFSASWDIVADEEKIRVIAPSYGCSDNLEKLNDNIRKLGFCAQFSTDLISTQALFGAANTEEYRQKDFQNALESADAKVIWALRGGRDGTALFSDETNWEWLRSFRPETAKLCIGFSDFTAVHLYVNNVLNWPSLHWCVLAYNKDANSAINKDTSLMEIIPILKGEIRELNYVLTPVNNAARNMPSFINAVIIGGNASLVQRNIGTDCCPKIDERAFTEDKIFFLEDIGEPVSKLKEVFRHFKRVGFLKKPKAIFLGNFRIDSKEGAQYSEFKDWLSKEMKDLIPIYESNDFGHGTINRPLFFNTPSSIYLDVNGRIMLTNSTNNW